jgi:hypothetical protein
METKKQARNLKVGDFVHYYNGDLLHPDRTFEPNHPFSGTILKIRGKGNIGIALKTVNGWTREFNRLKHFTVEIREEESRIDRALIVSPLKPAETFQRLSIE